MRQAIQTKYLGPTNTRGSRIKAWCNAGSVTRPYDDALNQARNHASAAETLVKRLGWRGEWHGGANDVGYVFVTPDDDGFTVL